MPPPHESWIGVLAMPTSDETSQVTANMANAHIPSTLPSTESAESTITPPPCGSQSLSSTIENNSGDLDVDIDCEPANRLNNATRSEITRLSRCRMFHYADMLRERYPMRKLTQASLAAELEKTKLFYTCGHRTRKRTLSSATQISRFIDRTFSSKTGFPRKEVRKEVWLQKGTRGLNKESLAKLQYEAYLRTPSLHPVCPSKHDDPSPQPTLQNSKEADDDGDQTENRVRSPRRQKTPTERREGPSNPELTLKLPNFPPRGTTQPIRRLRSAPDTSAGPKVSKRNKNNDPCTSPKEQRRARQRSAQRVGQDDAVILFEQPNLLDFAPAAPAPASNSSALEITREPVAAATEILDVMQNDTEMTTGEQNTRHAPSPMVRAPIFRPDYKVFKKNCDDICVLLVSHVLRYLRKRQFDYGRYLATFVHPCPIPLESLYRGITGAGLDVLRKRHQIMAKCQSFDLFLALTGQFLMARIFEVAPDWLETYDKFAQNMEQSLGSLGLIHGERLLREKRMNVDTFLRELYFSRCQDNAWLHEHTQYNAVQYAQDLADFIGYHLGLTGRDPLTLEFAQDLQGPIITALKVKCMLSTSPKKHAFLWYTPGAQADKRKMEEVSNDDQILLTFFPGVVFQDDTNEEIVFKAHVSHIGTAAAAINV